MQKVGPVQTHPGDGTEDDGITLGRHGNQMWSALLRRLGLRSSDGPATYRTFTTKFDRVISGNQINDLLSEGGRKPFEEYAAELQLAVDRWRASAEVAAVEALTTVKRTHGDKPTSNTVACLLVDHSGSMRGQRAILATAIVEIVADFWSRLGIRYEILGFTTLSWQGGHSREQWQRTGSPPNPGRLCDLLHIVYRTADDTFPGTPWAIRNLNRRELLKENVDGEAIEWASSRLLARQEDKKVLIVLSDGAPVDDSTLAANDVGYLQRHLLSVLRTLETTPISVGAIGMGDFTPGGYQQHVMIDTPQELSSHLIPFISQMTCRSE